jgi:hypothetical protein
MSFEVERKYAGHQIVVKIAITDTPVSRLYIDGKVVDTSANSTARSGALLRGSITENEKTHIVEIKRIWPFTNPAVFMDGELLK